MRTQIFIGGLCTFALVVHTSAQMVEIPRTKHAAPRQQPSVSVTPVKAESHVAVQAVKTKAPAKPSIVVQSAKPSVAKKETVAKKKAVAKKETVAKKEAVAKKDKKQSVTAKVSIDEMRRAGELAGERVRRETHSEHSAASRVVSSPKVRPTGVASRSSDQPAREEESFFSRSSNTRMDTAFIKLADGFDFPVGKPDAQGYYKARGFRPHGHLGEDWDGVGGGDTDLGDPIYCIGNGVVVFARDCHQGWGNVIIVRHAFRDHGVIRSIDSLYGHLQKILVHRGEAVSRGQLIARMGNAHGLYDAHLHLEIRKNLQIGMSRAKFAQDYSNYYAPSQFILSHRHLSTSGRKYRVAMNTFTQDSKIHWDRLRNYSHARTGGGSRQSAYALKRALAAQNSAH
jgi:murein DD-endopeptidase MepM/ murein hydrolase activator NlpD